MTVRWGFIGAGWIARRALAPAVHAAEGAVLQAVAARDPARASALEPAGAVYGHYAELCDDPLVDAVYISLANDAHLPWTLRALASGKHVLCEKPLGLTAGQVAEMDEAAAAAGRLLVEASWYRWHPRTRRAETLLADGFLGPGRSVEAAFTFTGVAAGNYRLEPVLGGGALYDIGHYAVSAAQWALDSREMPLELVTAQAETGPTGVDLTTLARLRSPAGTADIVASFAQPPRQDIAVTDGTASIGFVGDAFTSWHQESGLHLDDGRQSRVETFPPVDPYRLMVEAVGTRVAGRSDAYVVPLAESAALAATLDEIRMATIGPKPSGTRGQGSATGNGAATHHTGSGR